MEKIRVFEGFAGIGSQRKALDRLGIPHEVVGISDWEINATISYNNVHVEKQVDYAENIDEREIDEKLLALGVSTNGKTPLTKVQIQRMNKKRKKEAYNAFLNTNNLGSIAKIDPKKVPDHDLFTYSFPCTDLSVAGLQRGMDKGSGTSSSMLWECQKIIEEKRPRYLMMENVKNLVGKRFKGHFDQWLKILEGLGYKNFWQVLNAKDYGIPQNRERVFVISIAENGGGGGHECFKFPEKQSLSCKLKDILEKSVDEKFYLSEDKVEKFVANMNFPDSLLWDQSQAQREGVRGYTDYAPCISAREYKDPRLINVDAQVKQVGYVPRLDGKQHQSNTVYSPDNISPTLTAGNYKDPVRVIQIGNIVQTGEWDNPQRGHIYHDGGLSPSLNTAGGGLEPKILVKEQEQLGKTIELPIIAASRGRNPANPSDRTIGVPTEQRLEINQAGVSNTITTMQKDNYVLEAPVKGKVFIKNATKQGYLTAEEGDCIDLNYTNSKTRRGRVQKECSHTLQTASVVGTAEFINDGLQFQIRKLTPKECWRLMGFDDSDFYKAEAVNSNSQLYKQAGNSIVVNVLEGIFANLFINKNT